MTPPADAWGPQPFDVWCRSLHRQAAGDQRCWVLVRSVDSTNLLVRCLLLRQDGEDRISSGIGVVAYEQTAGRGRRGNQWLSTAGLGMYLSLGYPGLGLTKLRALPLLAALGAAEAVSAWIERRVELKWPNDLRVGAAKIGGVLVESVTRGTGRLGQSAVGNAVVGVGVNCHHREPDLPLAESSSLELLGAGGVDPVALAFDVARGIDRELAAGDWQDTLERYRERLLHRPGDRLRCRHGGRVVNGRFARVNERAGLELETEDGVVELLSSEVIEG